MTVNELIALLEKCDPMADVECDGFRVESVESDEDAGTVQIY